MFISQLIGPSGVCTLPIVVAGERVSNFFSIILFIFLDHIPFSKKGLCYDFEMLQGVDSHTQKFAPKKSASVDGGLTGGC